MFPLMYNFNCPHFRTLCQLLTLWLIPYSHYKPKRSEANRTEPYCRIRTIHTSTECAAMRILQFDSFHTAHSRMRFVSHWKRSEAHYWVGLTRERLRVWHHRPRAHVVGSARWPTPTDMHEQCMQLNVWSLIEIQIENTLGLIYNECKE